MQLLEAHIDLKFRCEECGANKIIEYTRPKVINYRCYCGKEHTIDLPEYELVEKCEDEVVEPTSSIDENIILQAKKYVESAGYSSKLVDDIKPEKDDTVQTLVRKAIANVKT